MSRWIPLLFACLLLAGCVSKAEPAKPAGFIDPDPLFYSKEIPFHKVWWDPGTNFKEFREIYIAPVSTEHLLKMSWWQELERGSSIKKDLPELGAMTRQCLREAFQNDPRQRFRVVDFPRSNTLVLQFALVEIIPTKTTLHFLGWIPPIALPMKLVNLGNKSSAAFEAKFQRGLNGPVIAMFADREAEKISIITAKDYTWYAHAKSIIKEWAKQFVQIANKERFKIVPDSKLYEIKPW